MPETVIDAVFDELQTSHPLLSHIQFMNTRGAIRMIDEYKRLSDGGMGTALR